jgi:hypothetical protein
VHYNRAFGLEAAQFGVSKEQEGSKRVYDAYPPPTHRAHYL